ncbi:hypothetical protein [Muricoccus nepalensis]|uniref:hypothetical protein n=1 Tax=Muricoccus nepalensis TaxID=1854500 RepID=UPI001386A9DD|nr:hypothetical protein [Roseomonas nepalensis]
MWLIWGALVCVAVLLMPSWKGGRRAYQSGWAGTVLFAVVAVGIGLLIWQGAR